MSTQAKPRQPVQGQPVKSIFDDAVAFRRLVNESFKRAAKLAVAENDRLGIATNGSVNGKLVVRQPTSEK
jgi:hypothetical protein